ncbi:glycolate oxidase subunit GlcF [Motiliproteus sp. MSK22-1]|uniref:glycolate oxidase subunit GlcF n=1 Tax=Motiliproteus sp. MSK22-1 TaxID=1897630 RepID=UPI000975778F|nr:glycolate oxidase subunit GlcF [Motiliproteus sp. MSK22-1]OMH39233.1 glycolate oxidase iron-sulfur subunit [Motiliproteus sp. MSK22-1]
MQTRIHADLIDSPGISEADSILRSCVHCGFCTATCPTYQELSDERDGPRGRIYLIKQLLEQGKVTDKTRRHLDRCLSCRSCETTCPSGVKYGRLLDIGRELIESQQVRPLKERILRWGLRRILPYPQRFSTLLRLGQLGRPLLPGSLKAKIPPVRRASPWPSNSHTRIMLALAGCAQPAAAPDTNAATARVLDRLGITLVEESSAGCCGAINQHLSKPKEAQGFIRRNIDAWWPAVEGGAEAIVVTASGCGSMVKEYGQLLKDDPEYHQKARKISALTRDISEVLATEDLSKLRLGNTDKDRKIKTAFHCPCSLQHGQQLSGKVEQVLTQVGIELVATLDNHLCCGSAGTYSILQPELSQKLLSKKLKALTIEAPEQIVTANIGCQLHLETKAEVPVRHWIEVLDKVL